MHEQNEIVVEHIDSDDHGAFFVADRNQRLAELTYVRSASGVVTIEHTQVSEALRGQGVARKLLDAAIAWARSTHIKLNATCAYAKAQFEQDPSIRDVLAR